MIMMGQHVGQSSWRLTTAPGGIDPSNGVAVIVIVDVSGTHGVGCSAFAAVGSSASGVPRGLIFA